MYIILAVFLFLFFLLLYKKHKKAYLILVLLQIISVLFPSLVGNYVKHDSTYTLFNMLFVNLNLFLIITPWSSSDIKLILLKDEKYFLFFKKNLYRVLKMNLILSILILIIVYIYIPDISSFKSQKSFRELYREIPYFANVFRYVSISQTLGYLAIPVFFFHIGKQEYKKSREALIYAISSLIAAFAFYSRAQILTFALLLFIYFFLVKNTLPLILQKKISQKLKIISVLIMTLFLVITVVRFSAMDYYGDRMPESSIIKDPIIYNLADYATQGYVNGINQLEKYSENKNLKGEQLFRDVYQILNFIGVMSWDVDESKEKISKTYNYDGGAFKGYTCVLVFNFGYLLTFLISFIYYILIRIKLYSRNMIFLESMFILILFLTIPIVSIFYNGFALIYFPLFFILFVRFLYFLKK